MKRFISLFLTVFVAMSVFVTVTYAANDTLAPEEHVAKAIYGTPTIDGEADGIWDYAQINYVTNVYQNDEITPPSTCQFRVMYDDTYLYFLVEVKDETMGDAEWEALSLGGNLWKRDGVSLTFSPDNNRDVTNGQVAPAFWFIIGAFGNTANFNTVPSNVFISEDEGATKMFAISYLTDYTTGVNSGYTIELKVNLQPRYADIKMQAGTEIGFDIYLNDNNNIIMSANRNYGLTWTGEVNSYKNNAVKGVIELQDKDVKFENEPQTTAPTDTTPEEPTTTEPIDTTPKDTTTAAPKDTTTEAPKDTTTAAPKDTTTVATKDTTTADPGSKGGCGSVVAASALILAVAVFGGAVICGKKEN
ncbi:MAG: sugar-binding protein [Eubacteriales bacterium]|nr:sugar-binding protein [Eubacteriales bacterium]